MARRRVHPSAVILAYHGIVPRGETVAGEASLHTDQEVFGEQLDALAETHDVVPLGQVLAAAHPERPRAAITFDDAYLGCLTAGAEELEKRGLPYTVMVAPGILGTPCWWDLLAVETGALAPELREAALWGARGDTDHVLRWAREEGVRVGPELPPWAIPADEDRVRSWAERPGAAVGAHSWGHANLCALDPGELRADLQRCATWFSRRFGDTEPWFAYPYGIHDDRVKAACADLFPSGLRIDGGLAVRRGRPPGDPLSVPRVNVPRGLTINGLRLRLAGILGG